MLEIVIKHNDYNAEIQIIPKIIYYLSFSIVIHYVDRIVACYMVPIHELIRRMLVSVLVIQIERCFDSRNQAKYARS